MGRNKLPLTPCDPPSTVRRTTVSASGLRVVFSVTLLPPQLGSFSTHCVFVPCCFQRHGSFFHNSHCPPCVHYTPKEYRHSLFIDIYPFGASSLIDVSTRDSFQGGGM